MEVGLYAVGPYTRWMARHMPAAILWYEIRQRGNLATVAGWERGVGTAPARDDLDPPANL
jgi:hypothetical protein